MFLHLSVSHSVHGGGWSGGDGEWERVGVVNWWLGCVVSGGVVSGGCIPQTRGRQW